MMQITVNGQPTQLAPDTTLAQLLESMQLGEKRIAVECNQSVIPRSAHSTLRLTPGDAVEIVHAIGGG